MNTVLAHFWGNRFCLSKEMVTLYFQPVSGVYIHSVSRLNYAKICVYTHTTRTQPHSLLHPHPPPHKQVLYNRPLRLGIQARANSTLFCFLFSLGENFLLLFIYIYLFSWKNESRKNVEEKT